jgi:hypothetical protein
LTAVKGTAENTSTPASSCHEARTDTLRLVRFFWFRRQPTPAADGGEEERRRRGGIGAVMWAPPVGVEKVVE